MLDFINTINHKVIALVDQKESFRKSLGPKDSTLHLVEQASPLAFSSGAPPSVPRLHQ